MNKPNLPWNDIKWHNPTIFMPLAIGLIVASASASVVFYSGLWLSSVQASLLRWGAPWFFILLSTGVSLVAARLFVGHAKARLFYLLGPLLWIVSVILWSHWGWGLVFFLLGAICARLTAPPISGTIDFEEKARGLQQKFKRDERSLRVLGECLLLLFGGRLLPMRGSHAFQDRAIRMASFWLIVSGVIALSLKGPLWCWLPGLLSLCYGFLLRGSLLLRDYVRLSWLKKVNAGALANISLSPASKKLELPLFYLGEGVAYDSEIVFSETGQDIYRGGAISQPLALAPSEAPLRARLLWLRAAYLLCATSLLLRIGTSYFYKSEQEFFSIYQFDTPQLADLDNDGDLDLMALGVKGLGFSLNDGGGRFLSPFYLDFDYKVYGVAKQILTIDTNTDGELEPILIFKGSANYQFSLAFGGLQLSPFELPMLPFDKYNSLQLRDIDGDFDLDAAVCNDSKITLAINQGGEPPTTSEVDLGELWHCHSLVWWDLDQDQSLELIAVTSRQNTAGERLFVLSAKDATLSMSEGFMSGVISYEDTLVLDDFNGDGLLDLLGYNEISSKHYCSLYLGQGSSFALPIESKPCLTTYISRALLAGDIDADGDTDIVSIGRKLQASFNDGEGTFTPR